MRLIYFSPVPWASFAQRPHRFVEWFHRRYGGEVLWIDPYPTRLPILSDLQRLSVGMGAAPMNSVPAWLRTLRPRAMPVEPVPLLRHCNQWLWRAVTAEINAFAVAGSCMIAIGKPSVLALQALEAHPQLFSVYDAMDDFPAFYQGLSRRALAETEHRIVGRVRRMMVSSTALAERFSAYAVKTKLVRNACAVEALTAIDAVRPKTAGMVFGYVGTIGKWFDWDLVLHLANARPDILIRLIGPAYLSAPVRLPGNIEMLPACDHLAAMQAMQEFSLGLLPFRLTELTASVDPIKYYEYKASGLPVLSTPFGEMALRADEPGVFLIGDRSGLAWLTEDAIACQYASGEIAAFRASNSWDTRFDQSGLID